MTLTELLLPEGTGMQVDRVAVEDHWLVLNLSSTNRRATCPYCGTESSRINNHYHRKPADVPCAGYAVQLRIKVPCFFCDNEACDHCTFAERFPGVVAPYARRTQRLASQQQHVAIESSGEAGARILGKVAMPVSPDTLIRLVRKAPEPTPEPPRVLGLDDWAKKKGQSYGTILVDLERRRTIDVLPDRSAAAVEQWLADHPGVEIITRDRSGEYAAGVTAGATEVTQVADRFHLLQNLSDMLKRMFERQPKQLRAAAKQAAETMALSEAEPTEESVTQHAMPGAENTGLSTARRVDEPMQDAVQANSAAPTAAQVRFAEVKTLQAQGWSQRAVAEQLQMSRGTVRRYWPLDAYPKRQPGPQSVSSVAPYLPYLVQRWQAGEQNRTTLWQALQAQGYTGSYVSVWRATDRLATEGMIAIQHSIPSVPIPSLSARRAAWLFSTRADDLETEQQHLRNALRQVCQGAAEVYDLAQSFGEMVRHRQVEALDEWLLKAQQSAVAEVQRFAESLQRDYAAVKAALQYPFSNGPTEGHVNRLKFIKRQMYGRANFDLLRKRVLGYPLPV
jgi:transposase